ncbi:DUF6230 family protein [Cryptosporangium aurantiacum]|uniref:Cholesterol esterase n=1 Tax=Cryptosporangium aurantiacum TaxID=134849 RepID=A0A1M7RB74_9ACTN|nr:DUF6230 family protein [Cryptosporangium aurantiacum]SHN43382.1 hypothetical protein SAMN05443668_109140 [Cryptosporangium aurantiacum]
MTTRNPDALEEGRTRWGRTAVLLVPSLGVVGVLALAVAQGALAASFGVSGQNFKVTAARVEGTNVAGYLDTVRSVDGKSHPVMLAGVEKAEMTDVCTSAVVDIPVLGPVSLKVLSGQNGPVSGTNVVADSDSLFGGRGTVSGVEAGRDASTLDKVNGVSGPPGRFAVQAESLTATDVRSTAWSASGGTVELSGMDVSVKVGRHECY